MWIKFGMLGVGALISIERSFFKQYQSPYSGWTVSEKGELTEPLEDIRLFEKAIQLSNYSYTQRDCLRPNAIALWRLSTSATTSRVSRLVRIGVRSISINWHLSKENSSSRTAWAGVRSNAFVQCSLPQNLYAKRALLAMKLPKWSSSATDWRTQLWTRCPSRWRIWSAQSGAIMSFVELIDLFVQIFYFVIGFHIFFSYCMHHTRGKVKWFLPIFHFSIIFFDFNLSYLFKRKTKHGTNKIN